MCAGVDPSSSIEVLHIQDVMKIIQEQMELGFWYTIVYQNSYKGLKNVRF